MNRKKFVVSVVIPEGVTEKEMIEYIRDAVTMWSKGTNPDEPIFEIGDKRVFVQSVASFKRQTRLVE